MRIKQKLKAIDFFCSAGGVSCGFRQAGIDVLGGIDIDKKCKETYEKNIKAKFLHADVSSLEKEKLIKCFKIRQHQDDLIFVGCSPCQYYSNIKTDKTKSSKTRLLLADFQEFVDYYRPGYVFIENVPGLDKNDGSPLANFKVFLKNKGYSFVDGILNAKYYGVPQNRRRYILVASRIDRHIALPKPDKQNIKTVKHAIGDDKIFKPIEAGTIDKTAFIHTASALSTTNLKRIKLTPKNGGDRTSWAGVKSLQLDCYQDHDGHTDVYGRMSWENPSPTITTRFDSLSNGRYGHPDQDRAISLREGATLQSFPLFYKFYSKSKSTTAKMIGNAVPPELSRHIANSIIISLNKSIG
ncbi:MAG: DNA cytosine methyltransferase [Smithellaceae bacterium]